MLYRKISVVSLYFDEERVKEYLRITIGTKEEMEEVIKATVKIIQSL